MFELTISKQQVLTPLLTVAGAVDKKNHLAILSNILIRLVRDQLILTATDLEIEISAYIPCASSQNDGLITVPAKKMIEIIRSLDDNAQPCISCDDRIVFIKEGRSQFKLATLPAEHFPHSEDEASEAEFTLPKEALIRLFQSTHFAMSQQDVRVFLNGLLLELDAQSVTAVATDGHRMAICKYISGTQNTHQRFLIPRKAIQEMLRILSHVDDNVVTVSAGKNHFKLRCQAYTFISKLIEARFPPYTKAIPKNQDKHILIDRDIFKRALTRIMILANEKSRAVSLHMQVNQFTLIANNQEQDEGVEIVEAETQGEEIKIGINAAYVLDVLNNIEPGLLRLSMLNSDSSILVESLQDELYQYIIMPMKL